MSGYLIRSLVQQKEKPVLGYISGKQTNASKQQHNEFSRHLLSDVITSFCFYFISGRGRFPRFQGRYGNQGRPGEKHLCSLSVLHTYMFSLCCIKTISAKVKKDLNNLPAVYEFTHIESTKLKILNHYKVKCPNCEMQSRSQNKHLDCIKNYTKQCKIILSATIKLNSGYIEPDFHVFGQ